MTSTVRTVDHGRASRRTHTGTSAWMSAPSARASASLRSTSGSFSATRAGISCSTRASSVEQQNDA